MTTSSREGAPPASVDVWHDRDDRVVRVRLARPKANVLDADMVAQLREAFGVVARDGHVKAVVLDAAGPHFSFGASIEEHLPDAVAGMLAGFHALILEMLACPVPVLVAVRGNCLGGGLELASAGTLLFAAPDARLGQPEILLGVFAPVASCILPERMGQQAADELLLSGAHIAADDGLRLGLVAAVADDPEAAALAWYDTHLAGKSAAALRLAVTAARGPFVDRIRARLTEVEHLYLTDLMSTHDALEGLTAFLEKRPAQWKDG
ncbi:MAG: cyclohexa-1,5-dienecarbonyl-CoA hydratase [Tetrasphaera sp.]